MEKIKCLQCGNVNTEIIHSGKYNMDILFCPPCDDICEVLQNDEA